MKFAKIRSNSCYKTLINSRLHHFIPDTNINIIDYIDWQLLFQYLDWPVANNSIHLDMTISVLINNKFYTGKKLDKYKTLYSIA